MPQTQVIDWSLPLVPTAARKLLNSVEGGLIDLGDCMVIVPTVQSGRRLLETLALQSAAEGRGLLPPRILTPDQMLQRAIEGQSIANENAVLIAWTQVFGEIQTQDYRAVFPVEPARSRAWLLSTARRFKQLREELGAEGLDIAESAKRASEAGLESERWRQLAELEQLYYRQLAKVDLLDPIQARMAAARSYRAPAGTERIILIATVDPQSLPTQALKAAEQQTPLEVWTYGEDPSHFDEWGRPVTEIWIQRALDFEAWNCEFQTINSAKDCAEEIARSVAGATPESVLIGLADPELTPSTSKALHDASIPFYNPDGQALNQYSVGRIAELLCELAENTDIETLRSLLEHPDFFHWLESEASQNELLHLLDRLFEQHLAADLETLRAFTRGSEKHQLIEAALQKIDRLHPELKSGQRFSQKLAGTLKQIYETPEQSPSTGGLSFKEQASEIRNLLEHAAEVEERFGSVDAQLVRSIFQQALSNNKIYADRPSDAHDLLGWLELLWNDAPHLILAGLNEGIVPDSIVGDAFLPETLREAIGLRTNADRYARDAYLLEAICQRRSKSGQIDILVPQTAKDTSPLKPSRLLFQGGHETLLPRIAKLFGEGPKSPQVEPYHTAWKLEPPANLDMPESLSVSALKTYLECPFRFFLRHIMKMRPLDTESRELTPAAFGNLFHDSVETLKGRRIDSRTKAKDLLDELQRTAQRLIDKRYGKNISFAIRLQQEALFSRIHAFVERQLEDISIHGSIEISDTENAFEVEIETMRIRGRIDRIDQRDKAIELIDYKTSDSPTRPDQAHLSIVAKKPPPAHLPEEAFFESDGKTYRWTDLQLPLYITAQTEADGERPKVAYFNLAKTLDKSGIARWEGFTADHLASAQACAAAIIRQIQAGVFWPPNPDIRSTYDDFAAYFPDGIENSVQADAFKNYTFNKHSKESDS